VTHGMHFEKMSTDQNKSVSNRACAAVVASVS
jgi:hypothetical protein